METGQPSPSGKILLRVLVEGAASIEGPDVANPKRRVFVASRDGSGVDAVSRTSQSSANLGSQRLFPTEIRKAQAVSITRSNITTADLPKYQTSESNVSGTRR